MASGTLARLAIAIGIDDSQVTTGIMHTRATILSGLASIGAQSEAQAARTAANITRSSTSSLASVGGVAVGVTAIVATAVAGLGALAIKFESETAHIAAAADITSAQARKVGTDFLAAAGSSQTMIFTNQDMTDSYAKVAGQLALVDSKQAVYTQDMTFMAAATDLAAGSNNKLENSTSAIGSVLQNFGLKVSDSAQAANILFDASRGLNMSLGETTDTIEKVRGRLGTAGPSLKDTAVLVELLATHALTGQRNIALFANAFGSLLSKSADPTKLAAAQATLTKEQERATAAQVKYNDALAKAGVPASVHIIDLQKLQDAESNYQASLAKYGANTVQAQSALIAVETARNRLASEGGKGSAAVTSAQNALTVANTNLANAQQKVTDLTGFNNKTLSALNVTLWDAKGNFIGMRDTIMRLHDAYKKLTPEQQQATSAQLFGTSAAAAMTGIINDGTTAWDKYAANVGRANSAHEGALKATDNLASAWARLTAAAGKTATTISLQSEGTVKGLMDWATGALPVVANAFQTTFNIAMTVVRVFWAVVGPIFEFFARHQTILITLLGIFVARWLLVKGLNIAKEIAGWASALITLTDKGLPSLLRLIGLGEKGSITGGLKDLKNGWADAFSTSNSLFIKSWATDLEQVTKELGGVNSQLDTLRATKTMHPTMDISEPEAKLTELQNFYRTKMSDIVSSGMANPRITNAMTADLTTGITNPRIAESLNGVVQDAGKVFKDSLSKAAEEAAPGIQKAVGGAITSAAKDASGAIAGALARDSAGNLTGKLNTVAKTVATEATARSGNAVTDAIAKGGAVLSRIPGLGKVSGLVSAAFSQPVFVTNWPHGFGTGGGIPGNLAAELKSLESGGSTAAIDAMSVEKGVATAFRKDAITTATTSSISARIIGGVGSAVKSIPGIGGVTAAVSGAVGEGGLLAGAGTALTDALAPVAAAALPITAGVAALTGIGLTIAGLLNHGPLSFLGAPSTSTSTSTVGPNRPQPFIRPGQGLNSQGQVVTIPPVDSGQKFTDPSQFITTVPQPIGGPPAVQPRTFFGTKPNPFGPRASYWQPVPTPTASSTPAVPWEFNQQAHSLGSMAPPIAYENLIGNGPKPYTWPVNYRSPAYMSATSVGAGLVNPYTVSGAALGASNPKFDPLTGMFKSGQSNIFGSDQTPLVGGAKESKDLQLAISLGFVKTKDQLALWLKNWTGINQNAKDMVDVTAKQVTTVTPAMKTAEANYARLGIQSYDMQAATGELTQLIKNHNGLTQTQMNNVVNFWDAYVQNSGGIPPTIAQIDGHLNDINSGVSGAVAGAFGLAQDIATFRANATATWNLATKAFQLANPNYNPNLRTSGGYIPGVAAGGPARPGEVYWVGEQGPELFSTQTAGKILSVSAVSAARVRGLQNSTHAPSSSTARTTNVENLIVNNPVAEPASTTVERRLRLLSYTGYA